MAAAAGRAGAGKGADRDRDAAGAGAGTHRAPRRAGRRQTARPAEPGAGREDAAAAARGLRAGRRGVQPRLAQAARRHPLRQARPADPLQDRQGPGFHRGKRARRAGRAGLRAPPGTDGLPQRQQAEEHLHRPPAGADQPAHRAHPHQLPPGGDRHRPAVLLGPEPAEHPDPHRRGPAYPPGVRRAGRLPAGRRRLLADRAAHHGPPGPGRGPAGRLPP
ncbi:hypothetical protein D3C75_665500 [compost metagenome]